MHNLVPIRELTLMFPRVEAADSEQPGQCCISFTSLGKTFCFLAATKTDRERWCKSLKASARVVFTNFKQEYTLIQTIGEGNSAIVSVASRNCDGKKFAVKTIIKTKLESHRNLVKTLLSYF